jgi:hypothetical protein
MESMYTFDCAYRQKVTTGNTPHSPSNRLAVQLLFYALDFFFYIDIGIHRYYLFLSTLFNA